MPYWDYDNNNYNNYHNDHNNANNEINDENIPLQNDPDENGVLPFNPTRYMTVVLNNTIEKSSPTEWYNKYMFAFSNSALQQIARPHVIFQARSQFEYNFMDFDTIWINNSDEYVNNLSASDKYILRRYTRNGDEVVNSVLREDALTAKSKSLLTKMMNEGKCLFAVSLFQEYDVVNQAYFLQGGERLSALGQTMCNALHQQYITTDAIRMEYVKKYANDLRRVIRAAPPITNDLLTMRALQTDYLQDSQMQYTTIKGFTSTSFDPNSITEFAHNHSYKEVFELMLTPGTHAISMKNISDFPHEHEILLDYDCYVLPHVKQHKFMLSETYDRDTSSYEEKYFPKAYYNSRAVMVISQQVDEAPPIGEVAPVNPIDDLFAGFDAPPGQPFEYEPHISPVPSLPSSPIPSPPPYRGGRNRDVLNTPVQKLNTRFNKTWRNKKTNTNKRFTNTTRKNSNSKMNKIPSDASLPFWKVRDTSNPRISTDPIPEKERAILDECLKKYTKAVYGVDKLPSRS